MQVGILPDYRWYILPQVIYLKLGKSEKKSMPVTTVFMKALVRHFPLSRPPHVVCVAVWSWYVSVAGLGRGGVIGKSKQIADVGATGQQQATAWGTDCIKRRHWHRGTFIKIIFRGIRIHIIKKWVTVVRPPALHNGNSYTGKMSIFI